MNTKEALINYSLRLADNSMIAAQRLAEWNSCGPYLEEDIALSNMALDFFGQAETMYEYAAQLSNNNSTADMLAFRRNERQYLNCLLVEQPNGDFAFTMMKQFLYSAFAKYLYEALSASNDETLKGFAERSLKEVKYHFRHSSEWLIRFGNGTEESLTRAQYALDELWRYTDDLFCMNQTDEELISTGISVSSDTIAAKWNFTVKETLQAANLIIPEKFNVIKGGYNGIHSEHLGHLLCEMQYLQRAYPDAKW